MSPRRHDLDWIRVLAFALLILYHVGIGFVPWYGVWAYYNDVVSEWLQLPMLWLGQFRLPVLFLVSGMGTSFALRRRTGPQFVAERAVRLLLPLVVGANTLCITMGYYGALHTGRAAAGWAGFGDYALGWWAEFYDLRHVWHLWFILWLFGYSVCAAPLLLHLRNHPEGRLLRAFRTVLAWPLGAGLILVLPLPLIAIEWAMKGWAPGPIGGYMIPWYGVLFLLGYACISAGEVFWEALERCRVGLLVVAAGVFVLFAAGCLAAETWRRGAAGVLISGGWMRHGSPLLEPVTAGFSVLHALNAWVWCLAAFAWGARYLNRPGRVLTYCNQAVYPFYLWHLPFTLVGLYYMKDWKVWWGWKFALLTLLTFGGCWIVFELVKRTRVTRACFGIKPLPSA